VLEPLSVRWSAVKRKLILHPFFFASFASLWLISNNLSEIGGQGGRAVLLSLGFSAIVLAAFWLLTRDGLMAGMCASGAIVLFFSYGHVLNLAETWSVGQDLSAPLLILWVGLFAGWVYWVLRRARNLLPLSNGLNIIAVALNILPAYMIVTYPGQLTTIQDLAAEYSQPFRVDSASLPDGIPPDIYYIVLDAYARGDVLEELYDYDNSEFLEALEARGFWVDKAARANYTNSEISMASSLNMSHLTDMPQFLSGRGASSGERAIRLMSGELIKNSALRNLLEELGYAIIALDSGYGQTQITDADEYLSSPLIDDAGLWQIGIEFMLLDTTLGGKIVELLGEEASPHNKLFTAHRERVLFNLGELPKISTGNRPQFVFAHIVSPHVPFVFGREGEEITGFDPYTLLDRQGGNEANIELYRNQLHYLNSLVLESIDGILAGYEVPPIIVLQSDHGSKVYSVSDPPDSVKMDLQVPILNAILIPEAGEQDFYPGMTPVNTFRQILNIYFDADLDLKPDQSYILQLDGNQARFVEACAAFSACEAP